jgi:hypothetical protein
LKDRSLDGPGTLGGDKSFLRVKVILSRLVDDAQKTERLSLRIRQRDIDFPLLQRNLVPGIVNTDYKLLYRPRHSFVPSNNALDPEFTLSDTGRLVPMKFGYEDLSGFQSNFGNSFSLSPSTAAVSLLKSCPFSDTSSLRNWFNLRLSPMISKSIEASWQTTSVRSIADGRRHNDAHQARASARRLGCAGYASPGSSNRLKCENARKLGCGAYVPARKCCPNVVQLLGILQ